MTAVEGTLVIAAAAGRAVDLYGDKKEAGDEGRSLFLLRIYLCHWNEGIMSYQRG